MSFTFGQKSLSKLVGVHPDLVRVAHAGLARSPIDFAVTEGLRLLERQRELVAKGFSQTLDSKHLAQPDGWAHAFDVVAVGDLDGDGDIDAQDKSLTWDPVIYTAISVAMLGAAAELGVPVRWGGTFKTRDGRPFLDGPHYELYTRGT